jgi:hypothetical protein
VPSGGYDREGSPLVASQHTGEAAAVNVDGLQHLAAFADIDLALVGNVGKPHAAFGVDVDAVGHRRGRPI